MYYIYIIYDIIYNINALLYELYLNSQHLDLDFH